MTRTTLLYALLFLIPLVVLPLGPSPFETSKLILSEVLIEVLLLITLWHGLKLKDTPQGILSPLIILFLLTAVDIFFLGGVTSFWGNIFRFQGIFFFWHLWLFALIANKWSLSPLPWQALVLPLLLLSLGAVLFGTNLSGRAVGTLGEPNALGTTAVFFWPFAFFAVPKRSLQVLVVLLALELIFLTGSRSSLLALVMQIGTLFLVRFKFEKKVIIFLFALALLVSQFFPFWGPDDTYESRREVWKTSFLAFEQKPLLGFGWGNVENALQSESKKLNNNLQFLYVDSAHNIWLDYLLFGGLVAFTSFLLITLSSAIRLPSRELILLVGLLTALSFNPASSVSLVALWWTIGQAVRGQHI